MRHVVYDAFSFALWGCWGALGLLWISLAPARDREQVGGEDRLSRAAGAIAIGTVLSPAAWWRPIEIDAPLARAAGVLMLLLATAFTLRARLALSDMWTSSPTTRRGHRLITHGPYAVTRHPIYTGVISMLIASALDQGLGRWLVIAAGVSALVIGKARAEERLLAAAFPQEHRAYREAVPALVPRVGRPHPRR